MTTGRLHGAVSLALAAAVLAGCVPGSLPQGGTSGPVTVITGARGLTMNPYSARLSDRRIGRLLFRGLLIVGANGLPATDLSVEVPTVANGGITDGGKTVFYHVRRGAVWQDGVPLTAHDVAFTITALASGRLIDDPAEDFHVVTGAQALDDQTVRVTFSRPDSVLAWRLAPYVLPEHLLSASWDLMGGPYWDHPIGSGPYKVDAVAPDGTVDLSPVVSGAPRLRVLPFVSEVAAMEAFNTAENAVWLDAIGNPQGASESLSTTWGPLWRRLIFNAGPDSVWRDPALRHALALMTTQTVPATMPASAYPFGIRPPTRTIADTLAAGAALDAAGWRRPYPGAFRLRGGKQLFLLVGINPLRVEEDRRLNPGAILWQTNGVRGSVFSLTLPIRPTWTEGGNLTRPGLQANMLPLPAGRPFGWAWPFATGDAPSWAHPWGLNFAHFSDAQVQASWEAARKAPDPQTARARIAEAGKRIYALDMEIDIEPMPERVLSKGVRGVLAWPSEDEALAQASTWRIATTASNMTSAPAGR